ncbi:MAG: hypothetical protein ACTHMS_22180 [Jatrophihabitans sp.]|uniref:hypothetical protein n=1 Tax=Jatrophihabitans sp. TaxID=1932789 RepID=UPI003F81F211
MPVHPIPQPQLLDAHRVLDTSRDDFTADHEQRAQLLQQALDESCSYATQLWETLDNVRSYLVEALPPDPRTASGLHQPVGAHPTGPDDEDGWSKWGTAYAAATSVLCGPQGDQGFGLSEAKEEMTRRRDAPTVRLRVDHPELQHPETTAPAAPTASPAHAAAATAASSPVKIAGLAALGVLALRGLFAGRR